jgi:hypothetical protein
MATFLTLLGSGGGIDPGVGHVADPESVASGCASHTACTFRPALPALVLEPPPHPHSPPALAANSATTNRARSGRCEILARKLMPVRTPLSQRRAKVSNAPPLARPGRRARQRALVADSSTFPSVPASRTPTRRAGYIVNTRVCSIVFSATSARPYGPERGGTATHHSVAGEFCPLIGLDKKSMCCDSYAPESSPCLIDTD